MGVVFVGVASCLSIILYSRWRSGANVLSVVQSIEVVRISEVENIPYSLKFSRLKIFVVLAGCTLTMKSLSHEKFSTGIRTHAL